MTFEVCAFCRPEVAPGFSLAGIPAIDRIEQLEPYLAQHRVGVLLVEDDLFPSLPETLQAQLKARPLPMTVLFPAPSFQRGAAGEAYVLELLRRAIGYRVRIK